MILNKDMVSELQTVWNIIGMLSDDFEKLFIHYNRSYNFLRIK